MLHKISLKRSIISCSNRDTSLHDLCITTLLIGPWVQAIFYITKIYLICLSVHCTSFSLHEIKHIYSFKNIYVLVIDVFGLHEHPS